MLLVHNLRHCGVLRSNSLLPHLFHMSSRWINPGESREVGVWALNLNPRNAVIEHGVCIVRVLSKNIVLISFCLNYDTFLRVIIYVTRVTIYSKHIEVLLDWKKTPLASMIDIFVHLQCIVQTQLLWRVASFRTTIYTLHVAWGFLSTSLWSSCTRTILKRMANINEKKTDI
jgi:hypothetical protein